MGVLKTAGKIIVAPVVLPVKAAVVVTKAAADLTVGTAKVAGKMAYRTADELTFHAISSTVDTIIKERKK